MLGNIARTRRNKLGTQWEPEENILRMREHEKNLSPVLTVVWMTSQYFSEFSWGNSLKNNLLVPNQARDCNSNFVGLYMQPYKIEKQRGVSH
jgi:hypothetical protein